MSVAFDAVNTASVAAGNSTTLSWTHTPVGTPTAIGVFLMNYDAGATVTGVTYGGVALTLKQSQTLAFSGGGNASSLQIWGLASPLSGPQTVVVTVSIITANLVYIDASSETVTGSDPVTCFRTSNSAATSTGGATTISTTLASALSGDLVADIVGFNYATGGETLTPGGSQTKKWGNLNVGGNTAAGSIQAATGSTTMSWTCSVGVTPAGDTLAVAAAAFMLPAPPPPLLTGKIKPLGVPRINWQHPLTQKLRSYAYDMGGYYLQLVPGAPPFHPGPMSGSTQEALGSNFGTLTNSNPSTNPARETTALGVASKWVNLGMFSGNGVAAWSETCCNAWPYVFNEANLHSLGIGAGFSFACGFQHKGLTWTSDTGNGGNPITISGWIWGAPDYAAEAGNSVTFGFFKDSSNPSSTIVCGVQGYNAGSGNYNTVGTATVSKNTYACLSCDIVNTSAPSGVGTGPATYYVNGVQQAQLTGIQLFSRGGNGEQQLMASAVFHTSTGNSQGQLDGNLFWGAVWGRQLMVWEHKLLSDDPYCFLIFDGDVGDVFPLPMFAGTPLAILVPYDMWPLWAPVMAQ